MGDTNFKEIIQKEYVKCAKDPVHFMSKYCYIQHQQRGRVLFTLYPFQAKVLEAWKHHRDKIVVKSRQIGISTLSAGYALWLMLFHRDKFVLCIATKQEVAKNMVTKVKFMYDNLPNWLKLGEPDENNKLTLKFSNGSQIKAVSAASDAGRSESASFLIIDEGAFIENPEPIWASAQQTLTATNGECLILSTPNGIGNWFHKMWSEAEKKENGFVPIKLPWYVHPERDQKWRDEQDQKLGAKIAAQECDCVFTVTGDGVFASEIIEFYEQTYIKEPKVRRGQDGGLWVWEDVDYQRKYMVVADVARGDSKDYSSAQVIDIESNTQVAEYKGQLSTVDFGLFLISLATEYNEALLVIENSSIGWSTIQTVLEKGYRNFYHSPKNNTLDVSSYFNQYVDPSELTPGFTMSMKTRPIAIAKFREYTDQKAVVIRSKRLIEEMKVFIWKNGRPEARNGYNDDLVIPMSVGMFLRDSAFKLDSQNLEVTKQLLNNISKNSPVMGPQRVYTPNNLGVPNPYRIQDGMGGEEDIRWLL